MIKLIIIFALSMTIVLGAMTYHMMEIKAEKNQLELKYSYAMEMLGGFLSNPANHDEQVKQLIKTHDSLGTI